MTVVDQPQAGPGRREGSWACPRKAAHRLLPQVALLSFRVCARGDGGGARARGGVHVCAHDPALAHGHDRGFPHRCGCSCGGGACPGHGCGCGLWHGVCENGHGRGCGHGSVHDHGTDRDPHCVHACGDGQNPCCDHGHAGPCGHDHACGLGDDHGRVCVNGSGSVCGHECGHGLGTYRQCCCDCGPALHPANVFSFLPQQPEKRGCDGKCIEMF